MFIFDETPEDLAELAAEYHEHHTPSNPEETLLVETLVASESRLRRMCPVEIHLWKSANLKFQLKTLFKVVLASDPVPPARPSSPPPSASSASNAS